MFKREDHDNAWWEDIQGRRYNMWRMDPGRPGCTGFLCRCQPKWGVRAKLHDEELVAGLAPFPAYLAVPGLPEVLGFTVFNIKDTGMPVGYAMSLSDLSWVVKQDLITTRVLLDGGYR